MINCEVGQKRHRPKICMVRLGRFGYSERLVELNGSSSGVPVRVVRVPNEILMRVSKRWRWRLWRGKACLVTKYFLIFDSPASYSIVKSGPELKYEYIALGED